ncbi:MAG: MATE family efflux transporter [Gammaproteobacteria bacterium]|nr:MATE family efflux transporter [Gammaproteobacteria bacterium]
MKNNAPKLTVGPVSGSILSMMLPMALGILVMIGNGLVDAYFIGQLGYAQLAAVSYAFPVWFVAAGIVMGLGTGTSSVLSRFIGAGDTKSVKQIATHSMILAVLAGAVVTAIGLLSIESLFGLLGANEETMPFVKSYMTIYYWGSLFLGIPFIGNSILRANGDAKTPSLLVAFSAIVNAVLDPILIFGWFGFPEMGVAGAALASVISTVAFLLASLWVLIFRDNLLTSIGHSLSSMISSWKQVLHVGLPAIASNLIAPVSSALVTALVSTYGQEAVAAYGLAGRIEALVIVLLMALGGATAPYVGQNYGAKKFDRLVDGFKFSARFALFYSIFCILLLYFISSTILGVFTDNEDVIRLAMIQLMICPWGYGFLGIASICNGSFNAFARPLPAMTISISRTLVIYVPLAYLLAYYFGFQGIHIAQVLANIFAGCVAIVWYRKVFKEVAV